MAAKLEGYAQRQVMYSKTRHYFLLIWEIWDYKSEKRTVLKSSKVIWPLASWDRCFYLEDQLGPTYLFRRRPSGTNICVYQQCTQCLGKFQPEILRQRFSSLKELMQILTLFPPTWYICPMLILWRVQVVIVTTWTLAADPSLAWMDSVPSLPHIHWW